MVNWSMPGAPRLRRTCSHACCKARTASSSSTPTSGVGLATRALTGPPSNLRTDEAAALPITGGCVVHPARSVLRPPPTPCWPPSPSRSPGYRTPRSGELRSRRASEGLPSSHHHLIAVGTALAGGPPHRSQRALLTHWAPALGTNAKTHVGEGMHHAGGW